MFHNFQSSLFLSFGRGQLGKKPQTYLLISPLVPSPYWLDAIVGYVGSTLSVAYLENKIMRVNDRGQHSSLVAPWVPDSGDHGSNPRGGNLFPLSFMIAVYL